MEENNKIIDDDFLKIAERIKTIREEIFGGSNNKFADALGIAQNSLSAICNAKTAVGLTNILRIVNKIQEVEPRWLLTGNGPMLRNIAHEALEASMAKAEAETARAEAREIKTLSDALRQRDKTIQEQRDTIALQIEMLNRQSVQIGTLLSMLQLNQK